MSIMTPHELAKLADDCTLTLAAMFSDGVRHIEQEDIHATFSNVPGETVTLMLDLLKSRGIITFTFLLNEPLPIDTEILPAALDFAIKPKPTHFEQIKHRFLSHRPTAIVVIAFLVVAAVIALLRQAGIIG
jgi:hypothetical protein